jgi:hypothetical protein
MSKKMSRGPELNRRPDDYESSALPAELPRHRLFTATYRRLKALVSKMVPILHSLDQILDLLQCLRALRRPFSRSTPAWFLYQTAADSLERSPESRANLFIAAKLLLAGSAVGRSRAEPGYSSLTVRCVWGQQKCVDYLFGLSAHDADHDYRMSPCWSCF